MKIDQAQVRWLCLYPIKGLDGVSVNAARVLVTGALEFDRRWALVDARGHFVNGKNYAEVHSIRAVYDLARLEVSLDGQAFSLAKEGSAISHWFSDRLGAHVLWQENASAGFPDDTDSPGPTLVSSASVARVSEWFHLTTDEARRRFRFNIEVEGVNPFWEDQLYGTNFQVGDVAVQAINPCQRCVVPSRNALTGTQDAGFQKQFAELRKAEMPTVAKTAQFNHFYRFTANTRIPSSEAGKIIRVGDPVG